MKYLNPILSFSIVFLTILLLTGCQKSNNAVNTLDNTQTQADKTATQDVAYSVAANLAVDNGGALEEMSDVLKSESVTGIADDDIDGMLNFGHSHTNVTKQYDSTTGWWTITVTRQRGVIAGFYYSDYERVYQHQYLNKDGQFQKFYITQNGSTFDTAYTNIHKIVSGVGILKTPKVSHQLTALSGAWSVTGTNLPTVTINTTSPYVRSVADTITRNNAVRTLNGTLTLNFINVTGPRGTGLNWHRKLTGTISGTYHAVVTFTKGATYTEKTIDRTILITLGGQVVPVTIKGVNEATGTTFNIDAETGDFTE
jgi:hypothetical protein